MSAIRAKNILDNLSNKDLTNEQMITIVQNYILSFDSEVDLSNLTNNQLGTLFLTTLRKHMKNQIGLYVSYEFDQNNLNAREGAINSAANMVDEEV